MKEFIKKNEKKIIIVISFIITASCLWGGFWTAQKEAFFYPYNDVVAYENLKSFSDFDEININVNGKRLNGWMKYNNDKTQKNPLLIFFLGNAQNSSNFCYEFYDNFTYFEGYNFLVIDYPEYGYSEGNLNENELFNNAINIYDYAANLDCVDEENIVVMGYSIGTGMATYLAAERNVNGLILIAPYDNALNLYNDNLDIFYGLLENTRRYNFTSDIYAKKVKVSPLIIASDSDTVIRYEHSVVLSEEFKSVEKFVTLKGISHGEFFNSIEALDNIQAYLKERL